MRRFLVAACVALAVLLSAAPLRAVPAVPPPEAVLGFVPGESQRLADWQQVLSYLDALDAASPRVALEDIGRTTEGRRFVMAIVSSEENLARLEQVRETNARLADPRGLAPDEAERLVHAGKAIVAMGFSIHSTEVGGTLSCLRLLHRLASAEDPQTRAILDQTVVLLLPSANPDGTELVASWYRQQLGTPYEGSSPPQLYHPYVGHDNNRDWYMFTQAETRATVERLYHRWHPQIVHDVHQMGARGPRLFVPPYVDPWEPNTDGALIAAANALGSHVASVLTTEGRAGVVSGALFDAWTPSRAYPHTHGGVRILSETASARLASPIEITGDELRDREGADWTTASARFPMPWRGGRWQLADIVETQLAASLAILGHAARERELWLRTALAANRRACERDEPWGFAIPPGQREPLAAARLVEVLRLGGLALETARAPFEAAGRRYEQGTHVVRLQQPASAFAKAMLERQRYPDLREQPEAAPRRPYDVTAHTLPLLLGVEVDRLGSAPPALQLAPLSGPSIVPGRVEGRGPRIALRHGLGELRAAVRLLAAGVRVGWALQAFDDRGRSYPAGTLVVPASARARVAALARSSGFQAPRVSARPRALRLALPRVGLYRSWVPSIDEGWTRYVLERELELPYRTLRDRELRAGGLRPHFDVIVLPSQSPQALREGHPPGSMPPDYTGGLGPAGAAALQAFVMTGGTLVAFDAACGYVIDALELRVRNALAGVPPNEFYCPGSILEARPTAARPLAHGLPEKLPVWFEGSPAFDVAPDQAVLRYEAADPLLSGYLLGASRLRGRAALVEVPLGQGRVVLFGFRPQYRGQSWVTYPALVNALLLSAATPER